MANLKELSAIVGSPSDEAVIYIVDGTTDYQMTVAQLRTLIEGFSSYLTAAERTAIAANTAKRSYPSADQTKLAGIEAGATADQTGAEIKTAYEGESNTNAFTDAEKTKLAGLEDSLFLGVYTSLSALQTAHSSPVAGSYAYVDTGSGSDITQYTWDDTDDEYVELQGESTAETAASIKTKYESNADTNAYTDAEKSKLGLQPASTVSQAAAEAGTSTTAFLWTPQRVAQAIAALASGGGSNNTVVDLGNLGSTEAIDWSAGGHFHGVLNSDVTITFTNETEGVTKTMYLGYDGAAQRTLAFSDVDEWANGAIPTGPTSTDKETIVTVVKVNGIVYGFHNTVSASGSAATSGTGAPTSTPTIIGAVYLDTDNNRVYYSFGTASSADWRYVSTVANPA
jgi:hypothetical protein